MSGPAGAEPAEAVSAPSMTGSVVPDEGKKVCAEYAGWVSGRRQQVPSWFPHDPPASSSRRRTRSTR